MKSASLVRLASFSTAKKQNVKSIWEENLKIRQWNIAKGSWKSKVFFFFFGCLFVKACWTNEEKIQAKQKLEYFFFPCLYLFLCVLIGVLHLYLCTTCMPGAASWLLGFEPASVLWTSEPSLQSHFALVLVFPGGTTKACSKQVSAE